VLHHIRIEEEKWINPHHVNDFAVSHHIVRRLEADGHGNMVQHHIRQSRKS
jgi:hypothetical protein